MKNKTIESIFQCPGSSFKWEVKNRKEKRYDLKYAQIPNLIKIARLVCGVDRHPNTLFFNKNFRKKVSSSFD